MTSRNPQISSTSTPSSMDENIGRGRHGADHKLLKEAMRSIANGKKIMRKSEAVDMVTTYLGMAHADVETEFGKTGGMHLRFNCLQHVYVELLERCQEMEDDPESTLEEMTPIREISFKI
ncbi:hypothetical protein P8452_66661 [Trifolium repens]|nr:hypothetical protein P8452_66661 [Trifolium repens]